MTFAHKGDSKLSDVLGVEKRCFQGLSITTFDRLLSVHVVSSFQSFISLKRPVAVPVFNYMVSSKFIFKLITLSSFVATAFSRFASYVKRTPRHIDDR